MSKLIENPKTYSGRDLENIFFRPMLTGPDALDLGIKVMYSNSSLPSVSRINMVNASPLISMWLP